MFTARTKPLVSKAEKLLTDRLSQRISRDKNGKTITLLSRDEFNSRVCDSLLQATFFNVSPRPAKSLTGLKKCTRLKVCLRNLVNVLINHQNNGSNFW